MCITSNVTNLLERFQQRLLKYSPQVQLQNSFQFLSVSNRRKRILFTCLN